MSSICHQWGLHTQLFTMCSLPEEVRQGHNGHYGRCRHEARFVWSLPFADWQHVTMAQTVSDLISYVSRLACSTHLLLFSTHLRFTLCHPELFYRTFFSAVWLSSSDHSLFLTLLKWMIYLIYCGTSSSHHCFISPPYLYPVKPHLTFLSLWWKSQYNSSRWVFTLARQDIFFQSTQCRQKKQAKVLWVMGTIWVMIRPSRVKIPKQARILHQRIRSSFQIHCVVEYCSPSLSSCQLRYPP